MVGRETHVLTRTSLRDIRHATGSSEAEGLMSDAESLWARTGDFKDAVELAAQRERENGNTTAAAQLETVADELGKVEAFMNNLTESTSGITDLNQ